MSDLDKQELQQVDKDIIEHSIELILAPVLEHVVEILTPEEQQKIQKVKLAFKSELEDEKDEKDDKSEIIAKVAVPNNNIFSAAVGGFGSFFSKILMDANCSNPAAQDQSVARQLGFKRKIIITNISGFKAWLILSPAPISGVSSIGITKLGQIDFSSVGGQIKCQQSPLLDNSSRKFDLDNNQIYYTVFFDCEGKWKVHFKDRKINAKHHDINLLERHILEAVDFDFAPIN